VWGGGGGGEEEGGWASRRGGRPGRTAAGVAKNMTLRGVMGVFMCNRVFGGGVVE
jgi:hypothetical protein